jgi:hypothetical protein
MTIYSTLLQRGYFPKELPPSFFTVEFARFATTKDGRATLASYKPADNSTHCVSYSLALPGLVRRDLRIPHPASFAALARLTSKNFRRLLKRASRSRFSRSRPTYGTSHQRAIQGSFKPSNLARERASVRAGASYLLKVDVSQFYPSLYTHAVGWAVDPRLRNKVHWKNTKLLGKQLDQALLDSQGKISQGIPIGNDISFLLAETVLAQVDATVRVPSERCYRWFDDYEIACDTREQAEATLAQLATALHSFRLHMNPRKTEIVPLPKPAQDIWQQELNYARSGPLSRPSDLVQYFDTAFRLREAYPETPVLLYAIGLLFRLASPRGDVLRVAASAISQALLCEPGAAQKAFALLTFWKLNGSDVDLRLIGQTIDQMILRHRATGVTSDVSWALLFCLQHGITLAKTAGSILSGVEDDCIAIQALHMHSVGLLPQGFTSKRMAAQLTTADLDGEHWLLAYEALRQGFLKESEPVVSGNRLFAAMLARQVTFYRRALPSYAAVIHPGGAADWLMALWIDAMRDPKRESQRAWLAKRVPLFELMRADLERAQAGDVSREEVLMRLVGMQQAEDFDVRFGAYEPYA